MKKKTKCFRAWGPRYSSSSILDWLQFSKYSCKQNKKNIKLVAELRSKLAGSAGVFCAFYRTGSFREYLVTNEFNLLIMNI